MVNRWTCKYCNITINDDAPSRAAHEGGLRHKAAVERALRQTYKKAERDRREAAIQARQLDRIERAAAASGSVKHGDALDRQDEQSGTKRKAPPSSGGAATSTAPVEWKPTNKYAAYTTAANLGLGETPAEAQAREQRERREREGFASEWTVVVDAGNGVEAQGAKPTTASSSSSSNKASKSAAPSAPSAPADQKDEDDLRTFKPTLKTAPRPLHDDDEDKDADGTASAPLEFKKRTKKRRTDAG